MPEDLGNQVLEKLKRLSFVWDKKIKWKEIKEILKTETYRDPASLDSEGHKILKKVCSQPRLLFIFLYRSFLLEIYNENLCKFFF